MAFGQGAPPVTVTEGDGSPKITGVTKIIVTNGSLSKSGTVATITTGGATPGGSSTQVQYNNAGVFGGINTLVFDGTRVVFAGNPLFNVGGGALDNLIYVGSTSSGAVNASFGFFVGGAGSQQASDGPYFLARGNSFGNISNQRGIMFFVAGAPNSPVGNEGTIQFYTGNPETLRLMITRDGAIQFYNGSSNLRFTFTPEGMLLYGNPINLADLGTPSNGTVSFCADCAVGTDPCTGSSTGAIAQRLNGRWYCP